MTYRYSIDPVTIWRVLLMVAIMGIPPFQLHAQHSSDELTPLPAQHMLTPVTGAAGIGADTLSLLPAPRPGDVLNPNIHRNTPGLKLGIRAGLNRSAYSNDRYLDNTSLDEGATEGEIDIYTSAAGFGYTLGVDFEVPINSGLSYLFTLQYDHLYFSSAGAVKEPCLTVDTNPGIGNSEHEFAASIDYLKLAAVLKVSFTDFYLLGGLTLAHPLSSSLERTRRFLTDGCFYSQDETLRREIVESGEMPALERIHYAIRLGGGLIYQLTDRIQFSPELTLDFGASAINKSPNSDLGVYGVTATIRYDLR